MSTPPEPINTRYDGPIALQYDRDRDQWTAHVGDVDVVFEPGIQPNQEDLRRGLEATEQLQHPN